MNLEDVSDIQLDDVVHDTASQIAADVNNGGRALQIDWLLSQGLTESDILEACDES
jgi:hypothetical protein